MHMMQGITERSDQKIKNKIKMKMDKNINSLM